MFYHIGPSTFGKPIVWQAEQIGQAWRGSNLSLDDVMGLHDGSLNTVINYQRVLFVNKLRRSPRPVKVYLDSYMMSHGWYLTTDPPHRYNDWAYYVPTVSGATVVPMLHVRGVEWSNGSYEWSGIEKVVS